MPTIRDAAASFLSKRRIAVTGVSRTPESHGGNVVYQRLLKRGYEVFAVNPNATEVEGNPCYPNLKAIPNGVEAVVIATRPEHARTTMEECAELGIGHVWMHRSFGTGSFSEDAVRYGRAQGIEVIEGGCPLMFEPTSDPGHKFLREICKLAGTMPRKVPASQSQEGIEASLA